MDTLAAYRKQALKHAEIESLGEEGYVARISNFPGVVGYGQTKKETLADLDSVLEGWIELALKRGIGLPTVAQREVAAMEAT